MEPKKELGLVTKEIIIHIDYAKKLKESIFKTLQVETLDVEVTEE